MGILQKWGNRLFSVVSLLVVSQCRPTISHELWSLPLDRVLLAIAGYRLIHWSTLLPFDVENCTLWIPTVPWDLARCQVVPDGTRSFLAPCQVPSFPHPPWSCTLLILICHLQRFEEDVLPIGGWTTRGSRKKREQGQQRIHWERCIHTYRWVER